MRRNIIALIGLFATILIVLPQATAQETSQPSYEIEILSVDIVVVTIISTNDIHSAIDRFPNLATLVEKERAKGGTVILVDAGDRWTGNPYNDMAEEPYMPLIEMMNRLGYDYGTLGNHEFDRGQEILADRMDKIDFPLALANMRPVGNTPIKSMPPYIIKRIGDFTYGFISTITNYENGHPDGKPESFAGLEFDDPIETASAFHHLESNCDVFIGVTHIGYEADSLLALAMPELDLIIGGHSHTVIPKGKKINGVTVTQTGRSLQYAGVTKLKILSDGTLLDNVENRLVKLDTIPPAPEYVAMVEEYYNYPLAKVVGRTMFNLPKRELCNWFSDVVRQSTQADIAFYNIGGVRLDSLNGDITVGDIFSLEPFESKMHLYVMTGHQIEQLIMNKFNEAGRDHHNIDLYPSGNFPYKIITGADGNALRVEFSPKLKRTKRYRVGLSNYVSSAYNFDYKKELKTTDRFLTDFMFEELETGKPLVSSSINRAIVE